MSKKKALHTLFANRGLDTNVNRSKTAVLALEKQVWYGVRGFTGVGHFQTDQLAQPASLPSGSDAMTIAWGARFDYQPATGPNPMLLRYGNGTTSGWLMQELPVSRRIGWTLGTMSVLASHSLSPGINYTFSMTITGGLATAYVNGLPFITQSGRTYLAPNPPTNPFIFGGSFNGAVPAHNWTFNFFTVTQGIALTSAEVSGWDKSIRQYGPQALPSASHFWYAQDLQATGSSNHVVSEFWVDRISGTPIPRLTGSNMILEAYTPIIPTGSWA